MTDPLAFLSATLDAAQKTAEAARGDKDGAWRPDDFPYPGSGRIVDSNGDVVVYDEGSPNEDQAAHIVANDPAAVLRRIAADRQLIELHAESDFPYNPDDGPGDYSWTARCDGCYEDAPCTTLRVIAEGWGWTEETA